MLPEPYCTTIRSFYPDGLTANVLRWHCQFYGKTTSVLQWKNLHCGCEGFQIRKPLHCLKAGLRIWWWKYRWWRWYCHNMRICKCLLFTAHCSSTFIQCERGIMHHLLWISRGFLSTQYILTILATDFDIIFLQGCLGGGGCDFSIIYDKNMLHSMWTLGGGSNNEIGGHGADCDIQNWAITILYRSMSAYSAYLHGWSGREGSHWLVQRQAHW